MFFRSRAFRKCNAAPKALKESRNISKSAKVVTMSLEGTPPHPRELVTAWGWGVDPP